MGVSSLPKTVTRQRRGCDLNPGPTAPESSTLTTQLPRDADQLSRILSPRRGTKFAVQSSRHHLWLVPCEIFTDRTSGQSTAIGRVRFHPVL